MLIRFTVENLFSFGERKEFNMLPYKRLNTLNAHRYKTDEFEVLKMAALYGANGAGKSNLVFALRFLQKKHDISPAETMAFGDYNNDFEMLQGASYSYAMENAHEKIKAIANYQTTNNDDFGVERVLEALISKGS